MKTALYRHFDADGRLLYVGLTSSLDRRGREHRASADWWHQVKTTRAEMCLSKEHARDLERVAIRHEKPLYNKSNSKAPTPHNLQSAYSAILTQMEARAAQLSISLTTLGHYALQDRHIYARLKRGGAVHQKTLDALQSWLEAAERECTVKEVQQ